MIAGEQAKMGLASFLLFVAFLSLNLGVLNLLPIPILDGGHLLFLAIEGIRKKPVSAKVQEFTSRVGLSFLLCLMLVVTYHDIVRVLSNLLKLFK
jgi:regulator of sigma E protease